MGKSSNLSHQSEVPSLLSSVADILENGVLGVFGTSNEKVTGCEPFSQADHIFKGVEGTELTSTDTASDEIGIKAHPGGIAMSRSSSMSSDDMPELDRLGESTSNSSSGENTRSSGEAVGAMRLGRTSSVKDASDFPSCGSEECSSEVRGAAALAGAPPKGLPHPFATRWRNPGHSNSSAMTLVPGMSPRSMREEIGREGKGVNLTAPNSRMRSDSGFSPPRSSEARAEWLSRSPVRSPKSSTTTQAAVPFPLDIDALPRLKPPSRRTTVNQASKTSILQGPAREQLERMRKGSNRDDAIPARGSGPRETDGPPLKEDDGGAEAPEAGARRGSSLGPGSRDGPAGDDAEEIEEKEEATDQTRVISKPVGQARHRKPRVSQGGRREEYEALPEGVSRAPSWAGPDDGASAPRTQLDSSRIRQDATDSSSGDPHMGVAHHSDQGIRPSCGVPDLWGSRSSVSTPILELPSTLSEGTPSTLAEVAADIALRGSIASAELVPGLGRGAFEHISLSPSSGPVRVLAASVALSNGSSTDVHAVSFQGRVAGHSNEEKSSDRRGRKKSPTSAGDEPRSMSHRSKDSRSKRLDGALLAPKLTVVHAPGQVLKPIANQPQHSQYHRNERLRQSGGTSAEHRPPFRLSSSTRLTSFGSRSTVASNGTNNIIIEGQEKHFSTVDEQGDHPRQSEECPPSPQSPTIDALSSFGSNSVHALGGGGKAGFSRRKGGSGPARMERLESDTGGAGSAEDEHDNVYRRHHSVGSTHPRSGTERHSSYSNSRSKSCLYSRVSSHSVSRTISRSGSYNRSRSGGSNSSSNRRAHGTSGKRRSSSLRTRWEDKVDEHSSSKVHTRRTSSGSHSSTTHFSERRRHSNRRSHREENYAKNRGRRSSRSRSNSGGHDKKSEAEHRSSRRNGSRSSSRGHRHRRRRHHRDHGGRSESLRSSGSERAASFKSDVRDRDHSAKSEREVSHSRSSTRSGGRRQRRRDSEPDGDEDASVKQERHEDSSEEFADPPLGVPAGAPKRSDSRRSGSKSHWSTEGEEGKKGSDCLEEAGEGDGSRHASSRTRSAPAHKRERGHVRRASDVSDLYGRRGSQLQPGGVLGEKVGNGAGPGCVEDGERKADEHDAPPANLIGVPFRHRRKASASGRLGDLVKPRETSDASSVHGSRRRDPGSRRASNTHTGNSVPGGRNTVIIHSPLVRNKTESRGFPYFWSSSKSLKTDSLGVRPRSVPLAKSPVLAKRRTAFSEGTPTVGEELAFDKMPKAEGRASRKLRRGAGSLGASLVRIFGCSTRSSTTAAAAQKGPRSGGILGRKNAKRNDNNQDGHSRGRTTTRQAAVEARFGSGKNGRQLSQLYGYPESSIERTLAAQEENSSHGADRLSSSLHDEEHGGLRVQHLLRTSQVHSAKKKSGSAAMRSDCSSDMSARARGSGRAVENIEGFRHEQ